jgi:cytochrome b involved in lipid metabolism
MASLAEVMAEGAKRGRKFTVIEGVVYDITDYIAKHPGGQLIESAVGMDSTVLFSNHHPFTEKARQTLKQFEVKDRTVAKGECYPHSSFYDELVARLKVSAFDYRHVLPRLIVLASVFE